MCVCVFFLWRLAKFELDLGAGLASGRKTIAVVYGNAKQSTKLSLFVLRVMVGRDPTRTTMLVDICFGYIFPAISSARCLFTFTNGIDKKTQGIFKVQNERAKHENTRP